MSAKCNKSQTILNRLRQKEKENVPWKFEYQIVLGKKKFPSVFGVLIYFILSKPNHEHFNKKCLCLSKAMWKQSLM